MDGWDIVGPILLTVMVVGGVWGFASKAIPNLFGYINILVLYVPLSILLAGFIPDIISQKFKYSVVSIAGLIGVFLNRIISSVVMYFIGEPSKLQAAITRLGTDPAMLKDVNVIFAKYRNAYSGCSVPGFEFFESALVPQSLVLLSTMYTFLMLDILVSDKTKSVSGLTFSYLLLIAFQTYFNSTNGCFDPGFFVYGDSPIIRGAGMLASLFLISLVAAGIGYGIKSTLPADSVGGIQGTKSLLGGIVAPSNSGMIATKDVGISDQDQFVCDAYKNGELVTSTIVE